MKKKLTYILFMCLGILLSGKLSAQYPTNWSQVIQEEKGDTVVVLGYTTTLLYNTLVAAVLWDTLSNGERANPNRIYETMPGEVYISDITLELDARVPLLHITAPKPPPGTKPPLHIRALQLTGEYDKTFFQSPGSTYMENQYFCHAFVEEVFDREFMRCIGVGTRHEYKNCIFELTNWTHHVPMANRQTYKYTDCKFLNVGNEATLEKGCVLETRDLPPDTVWMENCTFLNGGILILGLENTGPMHTYFNHNTIVNVSQPPLSFPSGGEMVVTNNLFVNAGFVADYPGFYPLIDDSDKQPRGIVNIDTMDQSWLDNFYMIDSTTTFWPFEEQNRKILFHNNSAWWDPRFDVMISDSLKPIPDSIGDYEWMSQMILMNDRTKAMFDDNEAYPYLNEGTNLNIEPDFVYNKDLVDEWVSYIVTNSTPGAPNEGNLMPKWRTNMVEKVYDPDWPVLAILSYTSQDLARAGVNGYPLGDVNWFSSTLKETWEGTGESDKLWAALKTGELPEDWDVFDGVVDVGQDIISSSQLSVYPNPISSTTTVHFELTGGADTEIQIYDAIGKKVKSFSLGYMAQGMHNISLNLDDLSSGMYILKLDAKNISSASVKISVN